MSLLQIKSGNFTADEKNSGNSTADEKIRVTLPQPAVELPDFFVCGSVARFISSSVKLCHNDTTLYLSVSV